MLEDITFQMIITAVVVVASNGVTLRWLKSDLSKHEKRLDEYVERNDVLCKGRRDNIHELYERTNNMLSKEETATLIKDCVTPIKEDTKDMKKHMNTMADSMTQMTVSVARMDERMKNRTPNERNEDT